MFLSNSSFAKIKNLKIVFTEPFKNWLPDNELTKFISNKNIVEVKILWKLLKILNKQWQN